MSSVCSFYRMGALGHSSFRFYLLNPHSSMIELTVLPVQSNKLSKKMTEIIKKNDRLSNKMI